VQVPLEVTHTVLVTPDVVARIRALQTPYSRLLAALLLFFQHSYQSTFGFEHPPLHDPVAVAYVLAPHIFTIKHMRVDIETKSDLCSGRTVCDVHRVTSRVPQIDVAMAVDVERFWELMLAAVQRANEHSCLNRRA
jgi:inosine-uridine nucleoside N-ribohydrolase